MKEKEFGVDVEQQYLHSWQLCWFCLLEDTGRIRMLSLKIS